MDYFVGLARWGFVVAVTVMAAATSGIGINGF